MKWKRGERQVHRRQRAADRRRAISRLPSQLVGAGQPGSAAPVGAGWTTTRCRNAWRSGQWVTYGNDPAERRYSPLDQINASNVNRLGPRLDLRWSGEGGGNQEATPLVWNGVLYGITNWSIVFAVDARTGKELWRYDPGSIATFATPGSEPRHLLRRGQPRHRAARRQGPCAGDRRPHGGARCEVRRACSGRRACSRRIRPATRSPWRRASRRGK